MSLIESIVDKNKDICYICKIRKDEELFYDPEEGIYYHMECLKKDFIRKINKTAEKI